MKKFCEYLKDKRTEANLTQEQVADSMGVSLNAVQNWESGRTRIKKSRLTELAGVLNIDPVELENAFNDDGEDFSNFPFFMYTDEQNEIISQLRLTPEQKEFMMLIRIYNSDNWDRTSNKPLEWYSGIMGALRRIPFKYTEEKGVFRVYELGLHLTKFLRYVPANFCFDIIRNSPDTVFDLRTLDKKDILKWMDYCVFDKYYTRPGMDSLSRKNYYSNLSHSIRQFKEHTIDTGYSSSYSNDKNTDMTLYDKTNDQYRRTTIKLSDKGLQFQEWCKDIY